MVYKSCWMVLSESLHGDSKTDGVCHACLPHSYRTMERRNQSLHLGRHFLLHHCSHMNPVYCSNWTTTVCNFSLIHNIPETHSVYCGIYSHYLFSLTQTLGWWMSICLTRNHQGSIAEKLMVFDSSHLQDTADGHSGSLRANRKGKRR